jgi:hypothetical protein
MRIIIQRNSGWFDEQSTWVGANLMPHGKSAAILARKCGEFDQSRIGGGIYRIGLD